MIRLRVHRCESERVFPVAEKQLALALMKAGGPPARNVRIPQQDLLSPCLVACRRAARAQQARPASAMYLEQNRGSSQQAGRVGKWVYGLGIVAIDRYDLP